MPDLINDQSLSTDAFFFNEMMVHPAFFVHAKPQRIAMMGENHGILAEVLKHPHVKHISCVQTTQIKKEDIDGRINYFQAEPHEWLKRNSEPFDIIIDIADNKNYQTYHHALKPDGILVQPCFASLLDFKNLKLIMDVIQQNGFSEIQLLNFPHPGFSQGWRIIVLVSKEKVLRRVREKDIYNRAFNTRYYNLDTHKAAMALPEYLREELEPVS